MPSYYLRSTSKVRTVIVLTLYILSCNSCYATVTRKYVPILMGTTTVSFEMRIPTRTKPTETTVNLPTYLPFQQKRFAPGWISTWCTLLSVHLREPLSYFVRHARTKYILIYIRSAKYLAVGFCKYRYVCI